MYFSKVIKFIFNSLKTKSSTNNCMLCVTSNPLGSRNLFKLDVSKILLSL